MNIALAWFTDYGMNKHDKHTVRNALDESFIAHAKHGATEEQEKMVDECVKVQRMIVNENELTDDDVAAIKNAGLRLVSRPDPVKTNVVTLEERRVMSAFTSPEAA